VTVAPVIDLQQITKTYGSGDTAVEALRGIDLQIARGDYVAIMGASGSGKSTLMNIIGALDVATSGHYALDGIDIDARSVSSSSPSTSSREPPRCPTWNSPSSTGACVAASDVAAPSTR
jgi:ABC-type lipoprotein export system ATPase subunit